ncbi:MAG: flippase [Patescibacteria group bacterium]
MTSTKWNVAWNTGSQLLGKLVGSGAMFLVSILVARGFGAQGFGDFTKIITFVAFFYLLVDFGLNAVYLQRQTAPARNAMQSVVGGDSSGPPTGGAGKADWGTLFSMRLLGGILLMFFVVAILAFLPHGTDQGYTGLVRLGIILFSPTILIQGLIVSANAIFQKHLRYDLASFALIAGYIVTVFLVAGSVFGLSSRVGVLGVTTSLLLGLGVTGFVSLFFVRRIEQFAHISFDRKTATMLFMTALPLGITLLFNQVYFRIDSFVLTLTRSTTEVGLYGLAYKVFELPLVIPTFFMNSVYPLLLAKQMTKDVGRRTYETKKLLKKSGTILCLMSVVLSLTFWYAAPLLMYIRPEFAPSIPLLRILTLGLPFFFLSSLVMWALIALGKQIVLAGIYGSLMMVTVLLDILIIPTHGAIGAAWITVGSEGVVLLISVLYLRRVFHYPTAVSSESTNYKSTNMQMNDRMHK